MEPEELRLIDPFALDGLPHLAYSSFDEESFDPRPHVFADIVGRSPIIRSRNIPSSANTASIKVPKPFHHGRAAVRAMKCLIFFA